MNRTRPPQSSNRTSTNPNSLDFNLILINREWDRYFSYINQWNALEQLNKLQYMLIFFSKNSQRIRLEQGHVAFIFRIIRKFVEVLSTFNNQSIVPARYISTLLHRGGGLLKNLRVRVNTKIGAGDVVILLKSLAGCRDVGSQEIANSLYGLGQLAAGGLSGSLEARAIQALLEALGRCRDVGSQEIANSLYGVGQFAAASGLLGTLRVQAIQALLEKLPR